MNELVGNNVLCELLNENDSPAWKWVSGAACQSTDVITTC